MECLSRATACMIDTTLNGCFHVTRAARMCSLTLLAFSFGLAFTNDSLNYLQKRNIFYELNYKNRFNILYLALASTVSLLFFEKISDRIGACIKNRNNARDIARRIAKSREYWRSINYYKLNKEILPHQNSLQQQQQADLSNWLTAPGIGVDSQQLEVARSIND